MVKRYWTTRSGERLLITKMTDAHIENCIAYLESYHEDMMDSMWNMLNSLNGEQALYQLESDIARIEDHGFNDVEQDYIDTFKDVLRKRKEKMSKSQKAWSEFVIQM